MTPFIGFRWPPARGDLGQRARTYAAAIASATGLSPLLQWRGVIMLGETGSDDDPYLALPNETGFVFGPLFAGAGESASRPSEWLTYDRVHHFAQRGGEGLFAAFWGSYVALLVDREHDGIHLLRDPMGGRACFIAKLGEIRCFFSDLALFASLGTSALDLDRVAAFLAHPHLASAKTGLAEVEELLPGERLSMGRERESRAMLWRPPAPKSGEAIGEAAVRLASVAAETIGVWARSKPSVMHRLSGGLDSTVVLALLAKAAPASLLCVNESSPAGAEGDERLMARAAAAHFGAPLKEIIVDPKAVDFARCFEAPLMAAPSMSVLSFASSAYRDALGANKDAWLTSGQGGDQVFCRTKSSLIAADAARARPLGWAHVAYDVARLSGKSFWRVAGEAVRYGVLRGRLDFSGQLAAANAEVSAATISAAYDEQMGHPWLEDWRKMAPGRAERILTLLDALHYHAPSSFSRDFAPAPVLLSQPIVEAVMEIPSYVMVAGGRDRALYRAAFKPMLPGWVVRRTSKGRTTRHFGETIQRNRGVLRAALLDGELIKTGLIDKGALEAAANARDVVSLDEMNGLLTAFAAEVWLRSWTTLKAAPSLPPPDAQEAPPAARSSA